MFRAIQFLSSTLACLALVLVASPVLAQDDPAPIRLEKKVKPKDAGKAADKDKEKPKGEEKAKAEEKAKPEDKMKSEDKPRGKAEKPPTKIDDELKTEDPDALEREVQETINRLSKNFRTAEDKLQKKDPGDGTQTVQRDIVKDLDELIEQTRKQEEQAQQQQGQERQQQGQKQGQQGQQGQSKRQRSLQAQRNRQQRSRSAQKSRSGQQQLSRQQGQQQESPQATGSNPPDGAASKREFAPKVAEMYKDIWGHLPETLRQEMTQYTREQFMPKYNELLKQYYATIAEKGRKPGDR